MARNRLLRWIVILAIAAGQAPAGAGPVARPAGVSVAAWVRRTITGTYDTIYDSGANNNKWWVFIADNNKLGLGKRNVQEFYSTGVITDTLFHHVAVVKNGDSGQNVTFYIDGAASGTAAV